MYVKVDDVSHSKNSYPKIQAGKKKSERVLNEEFVWGFYSLCDVESKSDAPILITVNTKMVIFDNIREGKRY